MNTASTSPGVFISYATPDRERAFEICSYLEEMGHTCWIAPRNIRAGHDYGEEIIHGIEQCRCFVLILSSYANQSLYVKREVERAVSKAKPVFPVRLEDVLPSPSLELHLASLQYLDAWNGALHDHILTLAHILSGKADENQTRSPVYSTSWWRKPYIVAVGAGCVTLIALLVWWLKSPPVTHRSTADGINAKMNEAKVADKSSTSRQRPELSKCFVVGGQPVMQCQGVELGSLVHVRTPQGVEAIIPGGSGASTSESGGIYRHSTYLPWLGPGSSMRVDTADGVSLSEQALPDIPNVVAAVSIASKDAGAPPLFYARSQRGRNASWSYVFFAPIDTADVEWSTDSDGFIRANKRSVGPVWIDASGDINTKLGIRWRAAAGEWSTPVYYSIDVPAVRRDSVRPLQDLAGSIACYRTEQTSISGYIQCSTLRNVPLGELFDDLRWGTSIGDMKPVDSFDFMQWASRELTLSKALQPKAAEALVDCKSEAECQYRVKARQIEDANKKIRDARSLQVAIQYESTSYSPWQTVTRGSGSVRTNFLAVLPLRDDLYFSAIPRGGGAVLTERIGVSDHKPR